MALVEKYKLSADIVNKVRRERRVKPATLIPEKLQYLLQEQVESEEFFNSVQPEQSRGIPFWWERDIPLNLSKREHKKELAKQAQINKNLERQREEIEKASFDYIDKIAEAEREFSEKIKRNNELIELKRQELENLSRRQEEEYKHAFYELELQLQQERQARQVREQQAKGLKTTEELQQEINKREEQFKKKLVKLTREVEKLRLDNQRIQEEINALVKNKGVPAEFISFTKTGLIYTVKSDKKDADKLASEQAIRIAYGATVQTPPKVQKVAEQQPKEKKPLARIVIPKDEKWYNDSHFVPYQKDYQRVDNANLLEVKDIRVYDQDNNAKLSHINFYLRHREKSVVFAIGEDQTNILFSALTGKLQGGYYMPSGIINVFGREATADVWDSDKIDTLQEKLSIFDNKGKKKLKAILPKKLDIAELGGLVSAFGLEIESLLKSNISKLKDEDKQVLALSLMLMGKAELAVFSEPTAYLDHRQREILTGLINERSSVMLILTSDALFAANIKGALTFSL